MRVDVSALGMGSSCLDLHAHIHTGIYVCVLAYVYYFGFLEIVWNTRLSSRTPLARMHTYTHTHTHTLTVGTNLISSAAPLLNEIRCMGTFYVCVHRHTHTHTHTLSLSL